ncbi:MAG TPA: ACT domain-containing protein [Bacteroidota bacterium]|nr:ACT domain-containing protein [Bacteroidota bacterium]
MARTFKLCLLDEKFAISRLPQFVEIPSVLAQGDLCFISRTDEELSVICPEFMAPNNVQQVSGYRCFRIVKGTTPEDTGVIDTLVHPSAQAGISIFTVSTFSTTYIFFLEEDLEKITQAMQQAGHEFVAEE